MHGSSSVLDRSYNLNLLFGNTIHFGVFLSANNNNWFQSGKLVNWSQKASSVGFINIDLFYKIPKKTLQFKAWLLRYWKGYNCSWGITWSNNRFQTKRKCLNTHISGDIILSRRARHQTRNPKPKTPCSTTSVFISGYKQLTSSSTKLSARWDFSQSINIRWESQVVSWDWVVHEWVYQLKVKIKFCCDMTNVVIAHKVKIIVVYVRTHKTFETAIWDVLIFLSKPQFGSPTIIFHYSVTQLL